MTEPKALKRLKRKLTVENLWLYVINSILRRGEPVRAYTVRKMIREYHGLNAPTITVYMVVYRLVAEGLLEKITRGGETLYRVSDKGREAYMAALDFISKTLEKLQLPPSTGRDPGIEP